MLKHEYYKIEGGVGLGPACTTCHEVAREVDLDAAYTTLYKGTRMRARVEMYGEG